MSSLRPTSPSPKGASPRIIDRKAKRTKPVKQKAGHGQKIAPLVTTGSTILRDRNNGGDQSPLLMDFVHTQEDVEVLSFEDKRGTGTSSPKTLLRPGLKMSAERAVMMSERRPKRHGVKGFFPDSD